jgi:hypothetical protein
VLAPAASVAVVVARVRAQVQVRADRADLADIAGLSFR